ncbi:MAG: hypothetical protein C5B51_27230 [Terriglobia bacterium]|nr:MAG: hypothetical protein C5B51_27230 [Terriglobia bacterium]
MKRSIAVMVVSGALFCSSLPAPLSAQGKAAETAAPKSAPGGVPRMPDGHPDLSGVWWRGEDVGGRQGAALGGRGGRGGTPPPTFAGLYQLPAQAKAKTLRDKDDPSLNCTPTAFGTLNVSMFDVGAVGQIVQTPKFVVMLTETYHGYQIIPTDGRPHRDDQPPSNRGDAVGRWEGDTLVVDKTNFNDATWISAEGRVSFHSDALHITERYRRVDAKTLEIEATLEDPKVLTKPWIVPKQTLTLAPFDQLLQLDCNAGDVKGLIDAAQSDPAKN